MAYTLKINNSKKGNYGDKRPTDKIKYIVIHYTANDGDTDEANANYFKNNLVKASAHYFVDDDSVTQSVPYNYVAWSVGGSKYSDCGKTGGGKFHGKCTNANSISIELCDTKKNGVVYPTGATIENALQLTRELMKKFNIPASNVIRHFDVTGKKCPAYWVDDAKWKKEFWNKLQTTSPGTAVSGSGKAFQPYLVTVSGTDELNVRKEATTSAEIVAVLKADGVKYTIVEEVVNGSTKWGRLKSGLGYISLKYTEKV